MSNSSILLKSYRSNDADRGYAYDNQAFQNGNSVAGEKAETTAQAERSTEIKITQKCDNISVEWRNISYIKKSRKGPKTLLNNLSGQSKAGTVTAIMGPSGAGKTLLIHILSGYYERGHKGKVFISTKLRVPELFNKQSCYVLQDNYLLPLLTVKETLKTAADLRLASTTTKSEKVLRVEDSLQKWDLQSVADVKVCDLSFAEKRRLAIAQEILSNMPVIFIDEPTSGMDVASSLLVVKVLKDLASQGHTVIITMNQASAKMLEYVDQLHVLSKGEYIYAGLTSELLSTLETFNLECPNRSNPGDYILELAAGEHGNHVEELAKYVVDKHLEMDVDAIPTRRRKLKEEDLKALLQKYTLPRSPGKLLWTVFKRCFISLLRDIGSLTFRFIVAVIFGGLLGAIYSDSGKDNNKLLENTSLFGIIILIAGYFSLLPTVLVFPNEIAVFIRERRSCLYRFELYYLAKMLSDIPFQVLPLLILTSMSYWLTSQPQDTERFLQFLLINVQGALFCQALGFFLSALTSARKATLIAPIVFGMLSVFNCFWVSGELHFSWIDWLRRSSYFFYVFRGMLLAVYGGDRLSLPCSGDNCLFKTADEFFKHFKIYDLNFWCNVYPIAVMDIILRLGTFVLLLWRLRRKH